jgi:hypothetical protein
VALRGSQRQGYQSDRQPEARANGGAGNDTCRGTQGVIVASVSTIFLAAVKRLARLGRSNCSLFRGLHASANAHWVHDECSLQCSSSVDDYIEVKQGATSASSSEHGTLPSV